MKNSNGYYVDPNKPLDLRIDAINKALLSIESQRLNIADAIYSLNEDIQRFGFGHDAAVEAALKEKHDAIAAKKQLQAELSDVRSQLLSHCACIHDDMGSLVDECKEHYNIRTERNALTEENIELKCRIKDAELLLGNGFHNHIDASAATENNLRYLLARCVGDCLILKDALERIKNKITGPCIYGPNSLATKLEDIDDIATETLEELDDSDRQKNDEPVIINAMKEAREMAEKIILQGKIT